VEREPRRLSLSSAGLRPTHAVTAIDEHGEPREGYIAGERPLTLYLDKREIVTLMTLGTHPELLTLGYLLNQRLVPSLEAITAVHVDWDVEAVAVTTSTPVDDLEEKLSRRTVTTGCGQGTVFGRLTEQLGQIRLPATALSQSRLYALLDALHDHNAVYRLAGAVHGCALCAFDATGAPAIEIFVEDVGRHNAADAISGYMCLNGITGHDKVFYTTGRLTSEMVIKVAQMGVPVLLSRSGVTKKGLEFAGLAGVLMIARAKGRHFLVYNGAERVVYDAPPSRYAPARTANGERR
jgi:FdhD protein